VTASRDNERALFERPNAWQEGARSIGSAAECFGLSRPIAKRVLELGSLNWRADRR